MTISITENKNSRETLSDLLYRVEYVMYLLSVQITLFLLLFFLIFFILRAGKHTMVVG